MNIATIYGTQAFTYEFMDAIIDFGGIVHDDKTGQISILHQADPGSLQLGLWMEFVPEVYKDQIRRLLHRHREDFEGLLKKQATPRMKRNIIQMIQGWIWTEIEPA